MAFRVKILGLDGFKEIQESVQHIDQNIKEQLTKVGDETADQMKEVIQVNKKRPQAGEPTTLEDNIDVTHSPDGSWGVGEISKLEKNAAYWRAVNFGSSHMVGKQMPLGGFAPGEGAPSQQAFRQGRFFKGSTPGGESHAPIVTRPIPAMNYIEKTVNFVRRQIAKITFPGRK